MKHELPTVIIGIPAYNEEANIGYLLEELLKQEQESFVIEKIFVASDGSDDKTVEIARRYADRVTVIVDRERKGVAFRYNQLLDLAQSDIIVLLNADIVLGGADFIKELIDPIMRGTVDLTSSALNAVSPKTFVEKSLYASMLFKERLFETIRYGSNIYTCHGVARAFSKRFYEKFRFTGSIGEDAYSYLYCQFYCYAYRYAKRAVAYIRLPDNFYDHEKQSQRFAKSKNLFISAFNKDFVENEYKIPKWLLIKHLIWAVLRHPIFIIAYIGISLFQLIKSSRVRPSDTWEISKSSKFVRT